MANLKPSPKALLQPWVNDEESPSFGFDGPSTLHLPRPAPKPELVPSALREQPLFAGCDAAGLFQELDKQARRYLVEPGQHLDLYDGGPLVVVEQGALAVQVGDGATVVLGPGAVLNAAGMLSLRQEAEPFRPSGRMTKEQSTEGKAVRENAARLAGFVGTYEVCGDKRPPPMIFTERKTRVQGNQVKLGEPSADDVLCFYNLCPNAAGSSSTQRIDGWLDVKVVGAAPGVVPPGTDADAECFKLGGAVLAAVVLKSVEAICYSNKVTEAEERAVLLKAFSTFQANCRRVKDIWRALVSRCSSIFPGVPADVMWSIAQGSQRRVVEAGEFFVVEGDCGEDSEALILLIEGQATVEKAVSGEKTAAIGHLGSGAIIGDLCLIGAGCVRPASVRSTSLTEIVVMPAKVLLSTLRCYPGMLSSLENRLKEAGAFLSARLPLRQESLAALKLFEGCDMELLKGIAQSGERRTSFAGSVFVTPGASDSEAGTFYVLEYGECTMQAEGDSEVTEVPCGTCFGDKTLLGVSDAAGKTVRAVTPIIVALVIKAQALHESFRRYYGPKKLLPPFDEAARMPPERIKPSLLQNVAMFEGCRRSFIEEICESVTFHAYLPGQALAVQGNADTLRLVVIRGGSCTEEKPSDRGFSITDIAGHDFGKMALLGASRRWHTTVRAQTLCYTLEVSREALLRAIAKFPEEHSHFEDIVVEAMENGSEDVDGCLWPMLQDAPCRLLYQVELYAKRHIYPDSGTIAPLHVSQAAVLVVAGTASVVDREGAEIEVLETGRCFNEKVLLGVVEDDGSYIMPHHSAELQVLPLETWEHIVANFSGDIDKLNQNTMTVMSNVAAQRLGFSLSDPDLLRRGSALMRTFSDELLQEITGRLEAVVVEKGDLIIEEGKVGDRMLWLLQGSAQVEAKGGVEILPGKALGEAIAAGVSFVYSRTVRATDMCVLTSLKKKDLHEVLQRFPADENVVGMLMTGARKTGGSSLRNKVQRTSVFQHALEPFVELLCNQCEDAFFAGGEVIVRHGDRCAFGETPLYLLLSGEAVQETEIGVEQCRLHPGDILGEGGALGLVDRRTSTIRAAPGSAVHCAIIGGPGIEHALKVYPQEREPLEQCMGERMARNEARNDQRSVWLRDIVVPALQRCAIFRGFPKVFFDELAAPLVHEDHQAGSAVVTAGEESDSMIVLLSGSCTVETRSGNCLGRISPGGAFGEVAALGLLGTRTATLRSVENSRVLMVTKSALMRAVELGGEEAQAMFDVLMEGRQKQVKRGFPMCAMNVGAQKDDISVRAIALQALRIVVEPGQYWHPFPDDDPCGPHISVMAKGRGQLEMPMPPSPPTEKAARRSSVVSENGMVPVMPINPGMLLPEGMLSDYGIQMCAEATCELYRVRLCDFNAASNLGAIPEWMPRFRMIEQDTKKILQQRGLAARGIVEGLAPHPSDSEIHQWRTRRDSAIQRVKELKLDKLDAAASLATPSALPGAHGEAGRRSSTGFIDDSTLLSQSFTDLRRRSVGDPMMSPSVHAPARNKRMEVCMGALAPPMVDSKGRRVSLVTSPSAGALVSPPGSRRFSRLDSSNKLACSSPNLADAQRAKGSKSSEHESRRTPKSSVVGSSSATADSLPSAVPPQTAPEPKPPEPQSPKPRSGTADRRHREKRTSIQDAGKDHQRKRSSLKHMDSQRSLQADAACPLNVQSLWEESGMSSPTRQTRLGGIGLTKLPSVYQ